MEPEQEQPKPSRKTTKRNNRKKAFIAALEVTGNISRACTEAKINRTTFYRWVKEDEKFEQQTQSAVEKATDILELEARRRAIKGLIRYKFDKGQPIIDPRTGQQYYELEYSDTLLIFLLKGNRPEKYKDRHELSGGLNQQIQVVYKVRDVASNPATNRTDPETA